MDRLDGKVAIVTASGSRTGAATARLFVSEGASVVLTDLLEQEGEAVAAELGDAACFAKHDVTSEDDWHRITHLAVDRFGRSTS